MRHRKDDVRSRAAVRSAFLFFGRIGEFQCIYQVRRIAEYLNVDLNWLITGKYLEERRSEYNQKVEISGDGARASHIYIIKDGSVNYERRKDYKGEKMVEIIDKCQRLTSASRDAVIKIIDVYLDIDNKIKK